MTGIVYASLFVAEHVKLHGRVQNQDSIACDHGDGESTT